ncbi:MAG: type IV toxin-antitoxin system AbiEi family antitoxin domain-containing protein [Actinomycetota bacterium]|nr:type IV toxin-antitoxin system AbiEi family antitoxin domain-containing protein [Actinomycetota bacterium]
MAAIDRRARTQHGLVTHTDLKVLGVSKSRLRCLVAHGQLIRQTRGLYRLPGAPRSWLQAAMAATLTGSGAVLSHQAAARLLRGEVQSKGGTIEVSVRRGGRRARRDGVLAHSCRSLPDEELTTRFGVPCTGPLRTLVDLAAIQGDEEVEELVSDFLTRRLVTAPSLCDYLSRGGRGATRPGGAPLRRCLDTILGSKAESVAEQRLHWLWRHSHLPPPQGQFEVVDAGGRFVARVDFALPALKIAVEMDGYRYHGDAKSFQHDRLRGIRLAALGWRVIHVTPTMLAQNPQAIVSAITAAVEAGGTPWKPTAA